MTRLLVPALLLVLPTSVFANVVWKGDFETGDRSQYSRAQMISPDRLQVVQSPTRQGKHALRVEVRNGDDPINASGYRNELVFFDNSREGTEYYYAWSTLWPKDYPMAAAWQVVMQWHHPGCCGAPPVRLVLGCSASDCGQPLADTLFLVVDGKTVWKKAGLRLGEWQDFILHIKWSADRTKGFVEMWHNNTLVLPKTMTRTMFASGDVNYLKMGLYRDTSIQKTGVLFHDALTQTTTLEAARAALSSTPVTPPSPPPAPPPTETPSEPTTPPPAPETPSEPTPELPDSLPPSLDAPPEDSGQLGNGLPLRGGCQSVPGPGIALAAAGLWLVRRRKNARR